MKLREVAVLFKLRLASLVVVSAALGYLLGIPEGAFTWSGILLLALAGTLLTGASNALNQVLEVGEDALMLRTVERPLVRRALTTNEAVLSAFVAGGIGTAILWLVFGPLTGILGFISLFMYVALYTPLKKHSPWAVFVGAFPGAFPPMLGYVAATGEFGLGPGLLFAMQFMWQFPHFWAIAWVLDEDYARAGFRLLPSREGRDRRSAFLILLYTLFVIPVGMLPWVFGVVGPWAMAVSVVCGTVMLVPAYNLFLTREKADARRLMFASFLYLPVVQLAYVIDRL
ncbi:MAG: protoheme IX farnesyltransferase [Flavobacteriales bacterium]|jgi:protoheme IX farnesyltransferase|nr:protoheme IX farnesyltransferase [Flavobacteriales bacterium]MBK9513635.1 protoheme IX farnesyltransferase [Flavobacteriales bacterium]HOZ41370.1 heme o synthase [Flavobacteriales bacterium]